MQRQCFAVDDSIFIRNFTSGSKWIPGVVVEVKGDLTIYVELEDGRIIRRHIDHVRSRSCSTTSTTDDTDDFLPSFLSPNSSTPPQADVQPSLAPSTSRCSTRIRRPPNQFMNIDDTQS